MRRIELTWIEEQKLLSLTVEDGMNEGGNQFIEEGGKPMKKIRGDVLKQGGEIIEKLFVFYEYFQVGFGILAVDLDEIFFN